MQVTINLPDQFTSKVINKWDNLPQKILNNLVMEAFKERLIDFNELKDLLTFNSDTELKAFLIQNNILHSAGLLNLYGACADIEFATDDDLIGVNDEQ
ncbi:hypothetical protein [Sphaerospermopsis sp. LEGE 08334]|jgi:hypothetical protein|uniref:hypothetical protein n=1 Tax=Sphaerospermopsis sp. LEGE 08334 TaxID=1828651 RepID=UPI00188111AB|nr:hypothetical protein [Sphaerospermopsis sp. LEGE 08334]MBE9054454.1 hypothetical protein [Sphaerospermopsis sp. LEGE 08334]